MVAVDILRSAGVPIGAARPAPHAMPDAAALLQAVRTVVAELTPEELAPYVAWLDAWHHHWPSSFRRVFGRRGEQLVERLRRETPDANRHLKLRRIAIENLSGVL